MRNELLEKGVKLKIIFNEGKLVPEGDGYLGGLGLGQFELQCLIQKKEGLVPFCFNVDGKKSITLMKDRLENNSVSIFSKKISVMENELNVLITRYPENNLRVFVPGDKGKFEIWEIAIVSQDGLFFLTSQITYETQCYRGEDGKVICPRFEWETKWPQLMEIIKSIFEGVELSPISEYVAPSPLKAGGLPKNHGKVVWWNCAQGWGTIVLDEKGTLARVYWKGILPDPRGRLRALKPGQIVAYQKLDIPSRALGRKTGFLLEAKEVAPLEKKNERDSD